jgi:hypothetical protein
MLNKLEEKLLRSQLTVVFKTKVFFINGGSFLSLDGWSATDLTPSGVMGSIPFVCRRGLLHSHSQPGTTQKGIL